MFSRQNGTSLPCLVSDATKGLKVDLELYTITRKDFGEKFVNNYEISAEDTSQIMIIDLSKVSLKYSKIDYPHTEFTLEKLTEFLKKFESAKAKDSSKLDL